MGMYISAAKLIDEYQGAAESYQDNRRAFHRQYPNGLYIGKSTTYDSLRNYIEEEKSENRMDVIRSIIPNVNMDKATRAARKWYAKTEWQYCLSEETAERLLMHYCNK